VIDTNTSLRSLNMAFDWNLQATQPAIMQARDYWQSCRNGRPMPSRADLKPAAMRGFTEHVGLIEIRGGTGGETDYFIRRAGTRWEDVFGPITGRLIHEFLPPQIETRWRQVFDAVCEAKAPLRVATDIRFQQKTWLEAELFVAPLGETEVAMLFLAFASWNRNLTI
jgi:hypothetical protein